MPDEPRIETIPIFPLPGVVLFPRARVPLHIFEPRYRQMTAAALDSDRKIGMVTILPDELHDMAGDPGVFPVGCCGLLQQSERLEDGRYDVVLLGTHRFRVVEEIPRDDQRLFRVARVAALEDRFDEARESIALQGLRADVIDLLGELLRHVAPAAARQLDPRRFSGIDDPTFVNVLCQLLDLPPAEKQGLLEADGLLERCERLAGLLRFRVAELEGGASASSRSVH